MEKKGLGFLSMCALVISVTIMAVPIAGIMGIADNAQAAPKESILRIGFLQKVDSLNPYVGLNDASYVFYGLVYDTLGVIDNKMKPAPDLALGVWAVPAAPDTTDPEMLAHPEYPYGSVWQYNLTHNATYTDGEPFTADDVVFNVNLNAGNYTSMWSYQPYSYYMKDAVKVDDYTVRIHFRDKLTGLATPCAYAYLISIPMLPRHMLQDKTALYIGYNWDGTFPDQAVPIVGTGPFMATSRIKDEWIAGTQLTLVKNPNYHFVKDRPLLPGEPADRWQIKFDKIVFDFFDDAAAMSIALKNGQLDVAALPPAEYGPMKANPPANITTFDGPKITQYWTEIGFDMNMAHVSPELDHNVRQALAMATDKTYVVDNIYQGLANVGSTCIPAINAFWHYEPNDTEKAQFAYNVAAANALLNASGYPIGAGGIRTCSHTSDAVTVYGVEENTPLQFNMLIRREYPEERQIGQYLVQAWQKVGVSVLLDIEDEATMSQKIYAYTYDTFVWYWSADIDPNYQLFSLSKEAWGGWSDNKWGNESYEQNYSKSVTTLDKTERQQYVFNCERVHYLDQPYIILAYNDQTYAWRTDTFTGWGNWTADPGRSIDNFWMGNPLYFDLEPKVKENPPFPYLALAAAVGAVAVVVALAVVLRMRGKKKEAKISDSPLGE